MLGKNVILITIDCLRADHMSCMGYPKKTTPNLDSLSDEGILFTQSISVSTWTPASFISILTSTYPFMYGGYVYPSEERTMISEVLKRNGYTTAAFHSNPWLSRFFNYDKGFDTFYDSINISAGGRDEVKSLNLKTKLKRVIDVIDKNIKLYKFFSEVYATFKSLGVPYTKAEALNKKAISWLSNHRDNFFLWIHYMDVHEPHVPPKGYSSVSRKEMWELNRKISQNLGDIAKNDLERVVDLYDAEIKYVDYAIKSLLDWLEQEQILSDTFVIITADHGQQFMEHGGFGHGLFLYDELVHVPLIIVGPGIKNRVIREQISLIDLAPTVLDLLGIKKPQNFIGNSLLPLMKGMKVKPTDAISEEGRDKRTAASFNKKEAVFDPKKRKIAYRADGYKYIYTENGLDEFYDLRTDPKETRNLVGLEVEKARKFRSKIIEHIQMEEKSKDSFEKEEIKNEIRKLKKEGKI